MALQVDIDFDRTYPILDMKERTQSKVKALMEQARVQGKESNRSSGVRSSLHEVIRTKEQADSFMHLLRSSVKK